MSEIHPTRAQDLPEVAQFLHEQLGRRFSVQAWMESMQQAWADEAPNHGMHLRHDGAVVGVLCAIYSDQIIDGRPERVCNPHSWVVLEPHRSQSIGLLLALLRQRGYHFTMFTPNPKVAQVFQGLRFRVLDDRLLYIAHVPELAWLRSDTVLEVDRDRIGALLNEDDRRDFEAHRHLPWLEFVAFGDAHERCLVVYKRGRWKKMACAMISHVSQPPVMARHGHRLRRHLLAAGMPVSRVEARFLPDAPPMTWRTRRDQPKLVSSPHLKDHQVRDLYSELMALDL